jgi:hypothetical protein
VVDDPPAPELVAQNPAEHLGLTDRAPLQELGEGEAVSDVPRARSARSRLGSETFVIQREGHHHGVR